MALYERPVTQAGRRWVGGRAMVWDKSLFLGMIGYDLKVVVTGKDDGRWLE